MKKKLALALVIVMSLSAFTACGNKSDDDDDDASEPTTTVATEVTTTEQTTTTPAETTTVETTAPAAPAGSETISDDVYSFELSVDGYVYALPMMYDEFVAKGWTCKDDVTTKIEPNSFLSTVVFEMGDLNVYCSVFNMGDDTLTIADCPIGSMNFDHYMVDRDPKTIVLPGNLEFGKSKVEEVIAVYGEPTNKYEGTAFTKLTYTYGYMQIVEINCDVETGCINAVTVTNLTAMDTDSSSSSASTEPSGAEQTAEAAAYKAPTELGTDNTQFVCSIEGDLYTCPCPASEFVKNGWTIKEDASDMEVAASNSGWVSLTKSNQTMKVMAKNTGDSKTSISNCFVSQIKCAQTQCNLKMELPNGIILGESSKADVEKALAGTTFEADSDNVFDWYEIVGDKLTQNIQIAVNKDTDKVSVIEINKSAS